MGGAEERGKEKGRMARGKSGGGKERRKEGRDVRGVDGCAPEGNLDCWTPLTASSSALRAAWLHVIKTVFYFNLFIKFQP